MRSGPSAPGTLAALRAGVDSRQQFSKEWIAKGARLGHIAKGVVYGLIGILALKAAFGAGGRIGGSQEAVQYLGSQMFGQVLLVLVGVGLFAYAAWRFIMAATDSEGDGNDASGIAKRLGYVGSGLMNGAVALTALQLALGSSAKGGGAKTWAAKLMDEPFGQLLIGALGVAIVGVGLYQFYAAYTKRFLKGVDTGRMTEHVKRILIRMGQTGYAARGVVFPIIGVALVSAAITHDPSDAKGLGEALQAVASSTFGQLMLIIVAAGLLAYGAFMVAVAKYRRVRIDFEKAPALGR